MVRLQAVVLLALVALGCNDRDATRTPAVETVPGLVITVKTTVDDGHVMHHQILASGATARSMNELDRWYLLDFGRDRVITVDSIARTWSAATLEQLRSRKESLADGAIPASYPPAQVRRTGRSRSIAGHLADEILITAGGFRRELWISREPIIDADYLEMRVAAEQPSGSFPTAGARLQLELMKLEGFPMVDAISVEANGETWGSRREVVAIEQAPVPAARLRIPDGFAEADAGTPAAPVRPTFRVPASPR